MFIERRSKKEESSKLQGNLVNHKSEKMKILVDQNLAKKQKAAFFVMAVMT